MMESASLKSTASMTTSASSSASTRPSSIRNQVSLKSRRTSKQMQAFEKDNRHAFIVNNEVYAWAITEAS
jgi:hypothetical protein